MLTGTHTNPEAELALILVSTWAVFTGRDPGGDLEELNAEELIAFWADPEM